MKKLFLFASLTALCFSALAQNKISKKQDWSERMAKSIMQRNEEPWMIDFMNRPVWSYPQGLVLLSFQKLSHGTNDDRYYEYGKAYADKLIDEKGEIIGYKQLSFNIDMINSGKILFELYDKTQDERYLTALKTLRQQIEWQPKTTEGGFWHKLRYPWQMWLDGAYMGTPFIAQYAVTFNEPELLDLAAKQLILMNNHLRDEQTGLLYHGWDESGLQTWSDSETGKSKNFWGRAIGWYAMAVVDALDYFPENHPKRNELITILNDLFVALKPFQDTETGLWSQVVDQPKREGNYGEASGTAMISYAMAKAVNKGYTDKSYKKTAQKAFDGLVDNLIEVEENGLINLTKVCAVAGLSTDRPGTFEYYINEKIRTNDPKGTGPFILAALELGK